MFKRFLSLAVTWLQPLKEVLVFLLISAVIIQGWKMLGLDQLFSPIFSKLFYWLMAFEFAVSSFILDLVLPVTVNKTNFLISFPNNTSLYLFEGCSGLKQVMQFSLIMLIYPGALRRKLWFIPFSVLALVVAAIIHFMFLCIILYKMPGEYEFMHEHISRWFFFGVFFLLWVLFISKHKNEVIPDSEADIHTG